MTFGFEMYLCLWNTVDETLAARVFNIQKSPRTVMFERSSKDVALSALFGESLSSIWFIVDQRFHYDRYKRCGIVVVLAVHVGVC